MSESTEAFQGTTLADAVGNMPDIEQLERNEAPARDEAGRFTGKNAQNSGDRDDEVNEQQTARSAAQDDGGTDEGNEEREGQRDGSAEQRSSPDEEQVDGQAVEEDWLEVEVDGSDKPQRLAVSEVYEGYQKAKQLEAEIENIRQTAPPPPEYDNAIMDAINRGQEYLTGLRAVEQMLQPFEPDQNLINPGSPNYDPEAYFAQQQYAQQQKAQLEAVQQQRQHVEQEMTQREQAVAKARFEREQRKLLEMWPEVKEEANAKQVREQASRFYGIDNETLDSVHDARFYAILKDALEYRKQQGANQATVRKVKAKPKLVKGKARDPESPQKRASKKSMARLMETGSREDAMNALDGLIE